MKKLYVLLIGLAMVITTACEDKVKPTAENPLVFTEKEVTVGQYSTAQLEVTNVPSGATVVYTSSANAIASVNESGLVTAHEVGVTYIKAFVEGDYESTVVREPIKLTVSKNPVTAITLTGGSNLIAKGSTVNFLINHDAAVTDRKVDVVTTDSVGIKFISYTTHNAGKRTDPDTLRVKALEYGKVELFVKQGTVNSNRVAMEVTGEVKSTDFKFALTPNQRTEGTHIGSSMPYNKYYKTGGDPNNVHPVTKVNRTACDTVLFDILPYNTTENELKISVRNDNESSEIPTYEIATVEEITIKVKEGDQEVTKKGIKITPTLKRTASTREYLNIHVSTNGGKQLWLYAISVNPADDNAKYAEVSKIEFEKKEYALTKWNTWEYAPKPIITFKDAEASAIDTAYTRKNRMSYEIITDYTPENKVPFAKNLYQYYDNSSKNSNARVRSSYFGNTNHGIGRLAVHMWNEDNTKIVASDSCNIIVNMPVPDAVFKSQYKFVDGKYVASALFNPMDNVTLYNAHNVASIKAELIFKKDEKAKEEIKETITLTKSDRNISTSWFATGEFTPFADGNKLSQYSVRYTLDLAYTDPSGNMVYFAKTDTFEVYSPNTFVAGK